MKDQKVRILQIANMNSDSGVACFLMNYYRLIDKNKVQFDFVMDRVRNDNFISEIEKLGGHVFVLPNFKKNPVKFYKGIKNILKEDHYDIVHSHEALMGLLALSAAKSIEIKTRIAHSHNSSMPTKIKNISVYLLRPLFSVYATHYLACSMLAGEYLFPKRSIKNKGLYIVHNAVDTNIYKRKANNVISHNINPENKFVVGHVGRFNFQKNHMFLIDIFKAIREKDDSARLLLVGDGETLPQIREKVDRLDLHDNVEFLGIRKDIPDLLNNMDVFVLPSLYEGLPVVAVEAQSAGLPCVLSDSITKETNVTGNVEFVSLNKSAKYWADIILSKKDFIAHDTIDLIKKAGFDLSSEVKKLQDFYINCRNLEDS